MADGPRSWSCSFCAQVLTAEDPDRLLELVTRHLAEDAQSWTPEAEQAGRIQAQKAKDRANYERVGVRPAEGV